MNPSPQRGRPQRYRVRCALIATVALVCFFSQSLCAQQIAPAPAAPTIPSATTEDYQTQPRVPADLKLVAQAASDFFAEKKFAEATRCYERMIQKYPRMLYAWSNLAVVYYHQKNLSDAEECLRVAVKLSPKDVFSLNLLGLVLMQEEKHEEAVEYLQQAFQLSPKDIRIALRLATALSVLNRDEEMRAVLKQAQESNPGDASQRDAAAR